MGNKKALESPVEKFERLSRELKHQNKTLEKTRVNIQKLQKSMDELRKKLGFCPACNKLFLLKSKAKSFICPHCNEIIFKIT